MNTKTNVKTISFDEVLVDLKRFAAKKGSVRPTLMYTQYDGQYLHATDSHKAIKINSKYVDNLPESGNFLYNVRDNSINNEISYPNLGRLYPDHFNAEIRLTSIELKEIKKEMKRIYNNAKNQRLNNMTFKIADGILTISSRDPETENIEGFTLHNIVQSGEDFEITFNAAYFKSILLSCIKLGKLSDDDCTYIKYVSRLRPFVISNGDVYEMLLLPIRTY